ncbi:MAG: peptidylprolyl isomerase [Methylacidiphilales bacterium]|nr:peptidylprolyl isomerase [Candidatus Methylacidiphilales bacterium]
MGRFLEEFAVVRRTYHLRLYTAVHLFVWTTMAFSLFSMARAQDNGGDGIVAVVNDKVITSLQVHDLAADNINILHQNYQGDDFVEHAREVEFNVLKSLIDRELIIQDFKSKGGFIPDTYTNEQVNTTIREQYGGDRVAFIKTLYARGITMQKFKDEIQDSAIVSYMRNKNVMQTVLVSPYQIEQYYQQNLRFFQQDEQIKVSTIVLRKSLFPSQKTDANGQVVTYDPQEEIAKEILYKLDTGADFADMARSYSEASNKDDGGELGWVTQNGKTAIRADLWGPISQLQPGQHTDVIATTDGFYYIVQIEDRKKAAMTPLEDVRAQIEQMVSNEETQVRQQQWLDSLRAKAFVKMFP